MPDEPDGHDLQRQLDRLREDLQKALDRAENHVTETGLAQLLRGYDERLQNLNEDVGQERGFRTADVTALRDWVKLELERLERRAEKADAKAEAQERERRADRRVVWGAAAASAASLLLWLLDRTQGVAP